MNESATRFPLAWPIGWKRTHPHMRRRAAFARSERESVPASTPGVAGYTKTSTRALTVSDAIKRLSAELTRLGATGEILSTNVVTRLDGLPRSGQPEPTDPGAAVYFRLDKEPQVLACDKWDRVADNIAAIAQHIDALRRIDRYGVGTMKQAFAGYKALTTGRRSWWEVLEFTTPRDLTRDQVEERYLKLAKSRHPDTGGSTEAFQELTEAKAEALMEVAA